ncbi:MAG: hypothetical protein ACK53A_16545 [Gemmatimonadota bacterium]|jgi:hypothetical protein
MSTSRRSIDTSAPTRTRGSISAHPNTITAARLLLGISDADATEAKLITDHDTLDGRRYDELLPVVDALDVSGYVRAATAVYRRY